jgi:NTP pyrophosphatase (non-canonical NTP hydrolase)
MRKHILFWLLVNWIGWIYAESVEKEIPQLLATLDSILVQTGELASQKELKIAQLKKKLSNAANFEEEFWINKMLYDESFVFNADSAMKYVDRNIQIATELKKKDWQDEWLINRSFMFAATGLLKEAGEVLEKVDSTSLSDGLKLSYYYQRSYLYSHLGQYMGDQKQVNNKYYNEFENANKHMLALVRPKDPLYWWCVASCNELSPEDSLFSALENVVLSSHHNTRLDAMNAYGLSNMYKRIGDKEKTMIYLIYSAMADLRVCNRDIASLQELSSLLYDAGDIDRAYAYMNYCLKAALLYPNRVRIISISTELDKIYANYQQRDIRWRNSLQNYLYVVTFFSIILVLALIGLYRQTKKLRKSRTELDSANHSLNQHVVELSQMHKQLALANQELQNLNELLRSANQKLQESNDVKEEYIGYVFSICSNYISKLDEYRKNINRKLKTGQFEEARQLTDNSSLTQNELKDFYANFDAIFLRVYPDFVADLNSLLRPEEQILLKDASELNTEVRIYALVRLGINDSVKIADFLHCSPQTVYNHRLRMRNKAIIPKDKFAEAVRLLGRGGK